MKQKLIEAIREVSIAGKTYEQYVEALAEALDKRFKAMFEELDVAVKMSELNFPEGLKIVHDFCERQNKKTRYDAINEVLGELSHEIRSIQSYHGWYIKDTIIPTVVKKILEEKNK